LSRWTTKGDEVSPKDLEHLDERIRRLRRLINNPIALIEQAQALLEGTAETLI